VGQGAGTEGKSIGHAIECGERSRMGDTIVNDTKGSQYCYGKDKKKFYKLPGHAALSGWGTPRVTTNNGTGSQKRSADGKSRIEDQVHGVTLNGSTVETTSTGQLNPALSRWLMGFPEEWCRAAIMSTRHKKPGR